MNFVKKFLHGDFDHTLAGMDHRGRRQEVNKAGQGPHRAGSMWNSIGG